QVAARQSPRAGSPPPQQREDRRPTQRSPERDRKRGKTQKRLLHQDEVAPPYDADESEPDVGHESPKSAKRYNQVAKWQARQQSGAPGTIIQAAARVT